jgi:hypothetical protein
VIFCFDMHLTSQATRTKTTKKCGNMIEKNFLQVVVTCFTIRNIGIVEQGKGFMMNWLSIEAYGAQKKTAYVQCQYISK